jgi:hypothetical protein
MNRIPVILLLFCLLSFACKKESETVRLCNFETPVITGFLFVAPDGTEIGKIGEPNTKTRVSLNDVGSSSIGLLVYPNPSQGTLVIYISVDDISNTKIWITRAIYGGNPLEVTNLAGCNTMVAGGYPIFQMLEVTSKRVRVNLNNAGEGYYRVYAQIHGILLWDNIIISKSFVPDSY